MLDSLRGYYLIAGRRLRDPNFFKSVVLIVEHNAQGAMGLVVNRPSSVTVAHALSEHFHLPATDDVVYVGGPVEPAALFVLHNASELAHDEAAIVPAVYLASNAEIFEHVVREAGAGNDDGLKFRIFSGCAGWGADQLEGEMSRGDWHAIPASAESLFEVEPYRLWEEQLRHYRECHALVPSAHTNPEWN